MRALLVLAVSALITVGAPRVVRAQDEYTSLPSIVLPPELDRVLRDYERDWQGNDGEALAALFTSDGFVASGTGWVRGTDAIQERYAETGGGLQLRALAFATADSVGYIIGAYGYGDQADPPDRGSFVLALRLGSDGQWLIGADLDKSNR